MLTLAPSRQNVPAPRPVARPVGGGRLLRWLALRAAFVTLGTLGWGYVAVTTVLLGMWCLQPDRWPPIIATMILGPAATLALVARRVARSHARLTGTNDLESHSAELRRIERDLHDGTQAQLVTLAMRLGIAEQRLTEDPEGVAQLLKEARGGAEEAMTELRGVIRTMYPPILADRGLAGAISGLAARSLIPVRTQIDITGALPAPVEAAAYFVVAEALTNAAKHSAATQILVHLDRGRDSLHVMVTDDGVGGVDGVDSGGTGIVGLQRRVAALGGTTIVDSPIGGGTTIIVEIPCGS